jgi:hypothetical protein
MAVTVGLSMSHPAAGRSAKAWDRPPTPSLEQYVNRLVFVRTWTMNAYSKDLRLRVLDALDRGLSRKEVSELFGLSLSTIKRYLKRRREGEGR